MFSFRDKKLAQAILFQLKNKNIQLRFMHVCGTHQDTLIRHGLTTLLLDCGISIGQGPGCPVCVTTPQEIEESLVLAQKGKIIATFGDMISVPGEKQSLKSLKTDGFDIRTVYGIEDAVSLAEQQPDKDIVFMAVGFETTAPTTASVLLHGCPDNFSILCCHRIIPPALKAILDLGEIKIDGFIEPGHVSTIIGTKPYEFISSEYAMPQVICGFEPLDLLMGALMLVKQIEQGSFRVENEYHRAVNSQGNLKAKKVIKDVFTISDRKWRGFPVIEKSGLQLKKKYEHFDARKKFEDELETLEDIEFLEPEGCLCGELLRGLLSPQQCPLFGKVCTPDHPVGPCMVSIEGSCHIEYKYSMND